MLERIRAAEMTLNLKCVLSTQEIDFVGYTVPAEGIGLCSDNLKAIKELEMPSNVSGIE